MQHPFSVKVTFKGKHPQWPALRGEIYERKPGFGDVRIGTFSRATTFEGYIPPIKYKFYSVAAQDRFSTFADSLFIEDTIEALM